MNLPAEFIEQTEEVLGKEQCAALLKALDSEPAISIRFNRDKFTGVPKGLGPVVWSKNGYYLSERPAFTFDPRLHGGAYYVQEASSMFLEQAITQHIPQRPLMCLDLCAAPGGKSTDLLSVLPEGSFLVANEVMRNRVQILDENLKKWGNPNTFVSNSDPSEFTALNHFFDIIVTDVPCSGEGMFRKDASSIEEWSPSNVTLCVERQQRILTDVWDALKPGGLLVYSTCTYNRGENEENVSWICRELGGTALSIVHSDEWGITCFDETNLPVYRFLPHLTKGEGFALAAIRKNDDEELRTIALKKRRKESKSEMVPTVVKNWLKDSDRFHFMTEGDSVCAVSVSWCDEVKILSDYLKCVSKGIEIATLKGKDIIPAHALALSTALNRESFPRCELKWKDAVNYLRKEALTALPVDQKGYVLIFFEGLPLGFVKHLGNRANNLYPNEWRIRSSYAPANNFEL